MHLHACISVCFGVSLSQCPHKVIFKCICTYASVCVSMSLFLINIYVLALFCVLCFDS